MARDKAEVWAHALVSLLLEQHEIELASMASRPTLEGIVAQRLTGESEALAEAIIGFQGVAELHADDETLARIVRETEPKPGDFRAHTAKREPDLDDDADIEDDDEDRVRDLSTLEPEMRVVLQSAAGRAARRGHMQVMPCHVLREMLVVRAVFALADRRGGDPDAAAEAADERIEALPTGGDGQPTLSHELLAVLDEAEALAPRWATIGDVALAAMKREGEDAKLFRLAFGTGRPQEDIVLSPVAPRVAVEVRRLEVSAALADAISLLCSHLRKSDEPWTRQPVLRASLSADDVEHCEHELGVHLPDDFWAAAAAEIDPIAGYGIGSIATYDDDADELTEIVLTAMSDAESDLEMEDFVAFADLREVGGEGFLCVRRGVAFAERQGQPVFVVGESGAAEHASFGQWLLERVREEFGEARRAASTVTLDARLTKR